MDEYISLREFAKLIGYTPKTVSAKWKTITKAHNIRHIKVNGHNVRLNKGDVKKMLVGKNI